MSTVIHAAGHGLVPGRAGLVPAADFLSPIAFFGAALILTGVMVATVELPRLRAHGQARMAGAPEHVS